jgi:hypothetical protein
MGLRLINGEIVDDERPSVTVRFYEHAKKVGIGKYVPVDYIEVRAIGQRDFMSRPATDRDKQDYPEEWAAYQSGLAQQDAKTTPLNALPAFKSHFGLELNSMGIHTVEELSFCDECPIAGCELLWKQAKKYVILLEDDDEPSEAEVSA